MIKKVYAKTKELHVIKNFRNSFVFKILKILNRMKKIYCLLFCCIGISTLVQAQDQHFTQFYASPLTLNPALAGSIGGKYRIGFIYRDQWRQVLEEPYVTFGAALDLRFQMRYRGKRIRDAVGIGLLFYSDRVPNIEFSTNQINLSGAYHKSLNKDNNQYLSLGAQVGISQRNVNYEDLTFDDQFNGSNGYTDPTSELLPANNFSFADYAVGLNYAYAPRLKTSVYAGFAIHHLLQPQVSFFYDRDSDTPDILGDDQLHMKFTGYINLQIPISDRVQLLPRGLIYSQGPHLAINAGTNFRFLFSESKGTALHLGSWVRPVSNEDQSLELDAVIGMLGIEYNNFLLGISYDFGLNTLSNNVATQGAVEISIAYLGEYENETIICPKF